MCTHTGLLTAPIAQSLHGMPAQAILQLCMSGTVQVQPVQLPTLLKILVHALQRQTVVQRLQLTAYSLLWVAVVAPVQLHEVNLVHA